jgi:hypothetical protein
MVEFHCKEDGVGPYEVHEAGLDGRLYVASDMGWIRVDSTDFTGVLKDEIYRIGEK